MKTDIYRLLGMIKDNKAPKKILYDNQIWNYRERTDMEGTILYKEYINEETDRDLFDEYLTLDILNDEVEILETTITYKQDNYYQYQPYTGEVEIKCNSPKYILESDKIEKLKPTIKYAVDNMPPIQQTPDNEELMDKINEIIDYLNK